MAESERVVLETSDGQMSDVIQISTQIQAKIQELDRALAQVALRADSKAIAIAEYEKVLAITILKLKNGKDMELGGERVGTSPVSVMEKIAKGICWQEKLAMEKADAQYKNLMAGLKVCEAQMNALQSIFRHMS